MKLKAAISDGAPRPLIMAFGSKTFTGRFLTEVVGEAFGVQDPLNRPAEYYVQKPDITIQGGEVIGVEVRLTGVSRGTRPASTFHKALKALEQLVEETTRGSLPSGVSAQVFVVIMIDDEVETAPGSGTYSSVLEAEPTWIKGEDA